MKDSQTHLISLFLHLLELLAKENTSHKRSLEVQVISMVANTRLEKLSTLICRSLTSTAAVIAILFQLFQTQLGLMSWPSGFSGSLSMQGISSARAAASCLPDLEDSGEKQKPSIKAF